jgi:hypothetical protein
MDITKLTELSTTSKQRLKAESGEILVLRHKNIPITGLDRP